MKKVALTEHSRASGCGCKIAPADLADILEKTGDLGNFDNLLVGHDLQDDAAVFDLGNGEALISTTDFFLPIVDDPYDFGYIAAINAINDVFAMGGDPLMAVAILGWPVEKLGKESASQVIEGGRAACAAVGIPLAGGHSIDALEPFFGLAVSGRVLHERMKTNAGAKPGDFLYLTKPIGTGIIAAAAKRGVVKEEDLSFAVSLMKKPNEVGQTWAKQACVHAMTDVTGFGLLGHLIEMCEASKVSAEIDFSSIPLFPDGMLEPYLAQFVMPDNTMRNFKAFSTKSSTLNSNQLLTLCDPQTSGGLLIASSEELPEDDNMFRIGKMVERQELAVIVS